MTRAVLDETNLKTVRKMLADDLTIHDIAAAFGVGESSIRRFMRRWELPRGKRGRKPR